MFWAGLVVGLILGGPLGMFALASMISPKRSQDELDKAASATEQTPVPRLFGFSTTPPLSLSSEARRGLSTMWHRLAPNLQGHAAN